MGTGVSPSLWLPGKLPNIKHSEKVIPKIGDNPQLIAGFTLNKLYGQASRSISTG
jgi:hypothetical protein